MSASSDSSGHASEGDTRSPSHLARRILRRMQAAPLDQAMAVADHQKACDTMMRLRDLMLNGTTVDRDVAACLTCSGIAVHRRILIGPEQLDAAKHLLTTQALLFVLVVLASGGNEADPTGHRAAEEMAEDQMNIAAWENGALWDMLRAADDDAAANSWSRAMREPGKLCQTILQIVRSRETEPTLGELCTYGGTFFRASAQAMAVGLLNTVAPVVDGNDFLTLDAVNFVQQSNERLRKDRLQGIADCAESEAGQTVRSLYFEPFFLLIREEPSVFLCSCCAT